MLKTVINCVKEVPTESSNTINWERDEAFTDMLLVPIK